MSSAWNTPGRGLALAALVLCGSAAAESVVTMVQDAPVFGAPKAYLTGAAWEDEAYVSMKVNLLDPAGASCIEPTTTDSAMNLFMSNKLDVVVTMQAFGLPGRDSAQEVPIAIYSWDNKGRYCRSAWKLPVQIVGPTPMRQMTDAASPGIPGEPYVVIHVRSATRTDERFSAVAQALLGIASAYATGGAANTVAGLTDLAGGPLVKALSDKFRELASNTTDQVWPVQLQWSDLVRGLQKMSFRIVQGKTEFGLPPEPVPQAIARIRQNSAAAVDVLRMELNFEVRRSVFVEDPRLTPGPAYTLQANSQEIATLRVLNFPRNGSPATANLPTVN